MRDFFMGWNAKEGNPIKLNGAFITLCVIICFVDASAAKAKLGALFLNCKKGMIIQMTLEELGHPQPKTQIHCNNVTAVDVANNTIKRQHLKSMEMGYFWVCDIIAQDAYSVKWHPGQENLTTTRVNTTWVHIIRQYALGTNIRNIPPWYYHKQHHLAL